MFNSDRDMGHKDQSLKDYHKEDQSVTVFSLGTIVSNCLIKRQFAVSTCLVVSNKVVVSYQVLFP